MIPLQLDLRRVCSMVGLAFLMMGLAQLAPLCVALILPERRGAALGLFLGALLSIVPGAALARLSSRDYLHTPTRREALAGVALAWLAGVASACVPYVVVLGASPFDALIESASGLTTVGATALCSGEKPLSVTAVNVLSASEKRADMNTTSRLTCSPFSGTRAV